MLGYRELADEKNVELFNLSEDSRVEEKVEVNGREIRFWVPCSLLETDLFINVPKMKLARETHITCALKNIFGCISSPRKIVYHQYLHEAIVGINKILHPQLTIVDGLVALSRVPVKLSLIMGGADPFSVDWISSQIMGYEPSKIGFMRIGIEEKLWDRTSIETCGESMASFRNEFLKESSPFSKWSSYMLKLLNLYTRVVGDVIPPALEDI